MRSASEDGYDGPANLRDAVRVAPAPAMRDAGRVVVMTGAIDAADDVTKTHATSPTTFQSLNFGPLGEIVGGRVVVARRRAGSAAAWRRTGPPNPCRSSQPSCRWMPSILDGDRRRRRARSRVEATGSGNTSPELLAAPGGAMAAGHPGRGGHACARRPRRDGVRVPRRRARSGRAPGRSRPDTCGGPKARVALAVGLGAGLDDARAPRAVRRSRLNGSDARRAGAAWRSDAGPRRPGRIATLAGCGAASAGSRRSRFGRTRRRGRRSAEDDRAASPDPGRAAWSSVRSSSSCPASPMPTCTSRTRAAAVQQVDLARAATLADGLALIAAAHGALPEGRWLEGRRLGSHALGPVADGRGPRCRCARAGDRALVSRPPRALDESRGARGCGITAATPEPAGGSIRRTASGEPDGCLQEAAATLVVERVPGPRRRRWPR